MASKETFVTAAPSNTQLSPCHLTPDTCRLQPLHRQPCLHGLLDFEIYIVVKKNVYRATGPISKTN